MRMRDKHGKLGEALLFDQQKTFQSVLIRVGNTNFLHKYTNVRH